MPDHLEFERTVWQLIERAEPNPYVDPNPFESEPNTFVTSAESLPKLGARIKRSAREDCRWGCGRPVTHVTSTPDWGTWYACTLHALFSNAQPPLSRFVAKYTLLEGAVVTDEEREFVAKHVYCPECGEFAEDWGCAPCHLCPNCVQQYKHWHCSKCQHARNNNYWRCTGCEIGQCCVVFCEQCSERNEFFCQSCCKKRAQNLRHPPAPPNRHMNQGIYVESHDWKTYPEARPAKPPYKPFLYLGVELEVECGSRRPREAVAKRILDQHKFDLLIKHDGSLKNGLECVTGPMSLEEHQKFWPEISKALIAAGCRAWEYDTPGLHVHCSRDWFTDLTIGKMLVFLGSSRTKDHHIRLAGREVWWAGPGHQTTIINKKLSDAFPPKTWQIRMGKHVDPKTGRAHYRIHRSHAWYRIEGNRLQVIDWMVASNLRIGGKVQSAFDLDELVKQGLARNFRQGYAQGISHYEALNLQNKDTIEFRLFKATLKADHILADIEYCHALSYWARDNSLREAENWPAFWEWVVQRPKTYPHLIEFFSNPRSQRNDAKIELRIAKEVAK